MSPPLFPFVVGCGRSGTTLLTTMLDSHPELAMPAESGGIVLLFCHGLPIGGHPDRLKWPTVPAAGAPLRPREVAGMLDELAQSHRYRAWNLDPREVMRAATTAGVATRTDLIRVVYAVYAQAQGKGRYGDKTPGHALHMRRLAELFPEAVFVHLIRDGRDVALSMLELPWGPADVAGVALHWADRVGRARRAGLALGPERYVEIRYEEMVADPEAVLKFVSRHIGLIYDPVMLCHGDAAQRQLAMSPAPEEDRNIVRPVTVGLRDWRTAMDEVDVSTFEELAGSLLDELGYPRGTIDRAARTAGRRRAERARELAAAQPAATW